MAETKGFIVANKAWYGPSVREPRIDIGLFDQEEDGEWNGSHIAIEWEEGFIKLTAFNDEWHVLTLVPEVLEQLAEWDSEEVSQDRVIMTLLALGYLDLTVYNDPDADQVAVLREYALTKLTEQEKAALGLHEAVEPDA